MGKPVKLIALLKARPGMSLEQFTSVVKGIWSDYWIERRKKFIRYPTSVFDRYLEELGAEGYFENVIFTNAKVSEPQ